MLDNATPWFKKLLSYAFDPKYQFYVDKFPKDYIPPTDMIPGISYSDIQNELRRVYLFQKGDPVGDSLSEEKRNILLIQILESFEPNEAKVFVNMLCKDLKTKGLTQNLVNEVFPEVLSK